MKIQILMAVLTFTAGCSTYDKEGARAALAQWDSDRKVAFEAVQGADTRLASDQAKNDAIKLYAEVKKSGDLYRSDLADLVESGDTISGSTILSDRRRQLDQRVAELVTFVNTRPGATDDWGLALKLLGIDSIPGILKLYDDYTTRQRANAAAKIRDLCFPSWDAVLDGRALPSSKCIE